LAAGDFDTACQRVVVFDLLGMVLSTERACGHPLGLEQHASLVCVEQPQCWRSTQIGPPILDS
jgi:hypothetical protein